MNSYETIFLITKQSYKSGLPLLSFLVILLGITFLILQIWKGNKDIKRYLVIALTILWGFFFYLGEKGFQSSYNGKLHEYISYYESKKYEIVEGFVEVLKRQRRDRHDPGDVITINGIMFVLDEGVQTPAYNTSIAYGGVLKNGVYAKVYYHDGKILRIDIKEEQPP